MITEGNKILLREEQIKNDVALKKIEKKQQRTRDEIEYAEVDEYIKNKYPDGLDKANDKKLINDGAKLMPLKCKDCDIYKVFPYDFIALNGRDYQSNRCKICTEVKNKACKKYQENNKIKCECGITYIGTELQMIIHTASQQHKDRMGEMIYGIRYTQKELIALSQLFKVPYYKKLTKEEMINELKPKLTTDLMLIDEVHKGKANIYKCIVNKNTSYSHKWEMYKNDVLINSINMNKPK